MTAALREETPLEDSGPRASRSTFWPPRGGEPKTRPRLERRSFWSTLWAPYAVPSRSEEDSLRCKLGCLVSWMLSSGHDVPARVSQLLSSDPEVRAHAAHELLSRRRALDRLRDPQAPADPEPVTLDQVTALHFALAECEASTAPVTGRTVSSVEDPWYIGYQRRRTLSARLWAAALLGFGAACIGDFAFAWVTYRLTNALEPDGALYPAWTVVVADFVVRPTTLFLWGLLGASLYLLRRLYQFTEARTFDHRMVEMYAVRLLMGGVAGALLALVLGRAGEAGVLQVGARQAAMADFGTHALAIVGGFSVRAVYSVLERISTLIREQLGRPAKAKDENAPA